MKRGRGAHGICDAHLAHRKEQQLRSEGLAPKSPKTSPIAYDPFQPPIPKNKSLRLIHLSSKATQSPLWKWQGYFQGRSQKTTKTFVSVRRPSKVARRSLCRTCQVKEFAAHKKCLEWAGFLKILIDRLL